MKYQNGGAFRRALEDRLRTLSIENSVSLVRLRKMVAFDRFLARLLHFQPGKWVVKGGLALQFRLGDRARTTKDMDVLAIGHNQGIYLVLKSAAVLDMGDWFAFEIAQPPREAAGDFGVPLVLL